jgi:hypothetical protein
VGIGDVRRRGSCQQQAHSRRVRSIQRNKVDRRTLARLSFLIRAVFGRGCFRVARDPGGASRVSVHNATRRGPTSKMAAYGWVFWRSRSSAPNPASRGANRRRCPARYALEPLALNRFESLVCRFSGGMRFQYGQRFASRQPYRRLVLSCRLGECLLHGGIVMFQFSQYFGGNTAD